MPTKPTKKDPVQSKTTITSEDLDFLNSKFAELVAQDQHWPAQLALVMQEKDLTNHLLASSEQLPGTVAEMVGALDTLKQHIVGSLESGAHGEAIQPPMTAEEITQSKTFLDRFFIQFKVQISQRPSVQQQGQHHL